MEVNNAKNRSSEVRQRSQRSELKGKPRSVGAFSRVSTRDGSDQIGVGREDSNQSDTFISGEQSADQIAGKLISQLIDETEKQLAYHEQQAQVLRQRLKELKQISDISDTKYTE
ncbi:hypothetical protein NIES4103_21940 [Nostoc sp. NIES-4103]|nr:hypothetical protein NIES4103_21940 [Nostoc sp. NIES-4103]